MNPQTTINQHHGTGSRPAAASAEACCQRRGVRAPRWQGASSAAVSAEEGAESGSPSHCSSATCRARLQKAQGTDVGGADEGLEGGWYRETRARQKGKVRENKPGLHPQGRPKLAVQKALRKGRWLSRPRTFVVTAHEPSDRRTPRGPIYMSKLIYRYCKAHQVGLCKLPLPYP